VAIVSLIREEVLMEFENFHDSWITCILVSSDGNSLFAADGGGCLREWPVGGDPELVGWWPRLAKNIFTICEL
jgi:hypothetical protein